MNTFERVEAKLEYVDAQMNYCPEQICRCSDQNENHLKSSDLGLMLFQESFL